MQLFQKSKQRICKACNQIAKKYFVSSLMLPPTQNKKLRLKIRNTKHAFNAFNIPHSLISCSIILFFFSLQKKIL